MSFSIFERLPKRTPMAQRRTGGGWYGRNFLTLALLLVGAHVASVRGQSPHIASATLNADGSLAIIHSADTNHYYLLLRGAQPAIISTPVSAALGAGATGQLRDKARPAGAAFYLVEAIPVSSPF